MNGNDHFYCIEQYFVKASHITPHYFRPFCMTLIYCIGPPHITVEVARPSSLGHWPNQWLQTDTDTDTKSDTKIIVI